MSKAAPKGKDVDQDAEKIQRTQTEPFTTFKSPPPTPTTILLCAIEERAPEVPWGATGPRTVQGTFQGPVSFKIIIDILNLQPFIVKIQVCLRQLCIVAQGELPCAWDSMLEQLSQLQSDASITKFFLDVKRGPR